MRLYEQGSKSYFVRIVANHQRLYISIAIGVAIGLLAPYFGSVSRSTRAIIGYDSAAILYIIWAIQLMYRSTPGEMQKRAIVQDDGKVVALVLVILALIFSLCAIFINLSAVRHLEGPERYKELILTLVTIVASWFFTNIVFALHYAHDYYFSVQRGKEGGLIFLPLDEKPSYLDFVYFSFVLGATAQTADITLASKRMRRTCLLHSILAFFFNTTLLALAVNMASGLL